jgi:probable HAF family extracellular repeat protein
VLPGHKDSGAIAINDSGAVVGSSMSDYNRRRAFLWRDGTMHDLGRLPGFEGCEATAINNSGHVLGYCTDEHRLHTFLWHDGHMQDLGVIGQGGPGTGSPLREWVYPEVLNDRDQIVVRTRSSVGGNDRPFLWQDGKFTELGTLPGGEHEYLWGEAINNHGQVIGSSTNQQSETFFTRACLWQDGAMTNIGHGRASTAMDINDRGQIVGYRGTGGRYEGYPVLHAVLWTLRSG